jgi:signal-transduction protein with cAMP-binding, CBS, and nucleotidyltransferase domain
MIDFINYCNNISTLTDDAIKELSGKIKTKSFKKGQIINKQGQICHHFYFIDKGLVKHYYHHKNRVFVMRFFSDNNIFTVLDSFIKQTPAVFMTVALEDTETTYIDYADVEYLCKKHHSFETFIRSAFSFAAVDNLKRIKEMFDSDATELYKSFIKENPHLLQRISLGDIAGYLGISQVSLSRIRAKL